MRNLKFTKRGYIIINSNNKVCGFVPRTKSTIKTQQVVSVMEYLGLEVI